jgi:hypothetical protein
MAHWRPRVETGVSTAKNLSPGAPPAAPEQSYAGKVVTYIPAEIIATYQAAAGVVPDGSNTALSWVGICLLIVAPIWTAFATTDPSERIPWFQSVAAFVAFAIWLLCVQNPSVGYLLTGGATEVPGYVRSLILIGAGLGFPLVEKILKYFKIPV